MTYPVDEQDMQEKVRSSSTPVSVAGRLGVCRGPARGLLGGRGGHQASAPARAHARGIARASAAAEVRPARVAVAGGTGGRPGDAARRSRRRRRRRRHRPGTRRSRHHGISRSAARSCQPAVGVGVRGGGAGQEAAARPARQKGSCCAARQTGVAQLIY